MVVRESMSLDLLNRLISDIFAITQILMGTDAVDLQAYQPGSSSVEKHHASVGYDHHEGKKHAKHPMTKGIHRTVC